MFQASPSNRGGLAVRNRCHDQLGLPRWSAGVAEWPELATENHFAAALVVPQAMDRKHDTFTVSNSCGRAMGVVVDCV